MKKTLRYLFASALAVVGAFAWAGASAVQQQAAENAATVGILTDINGDAVVAGKPYALKMGNYFMVDADRVDAGPTYRSLSKSEAASIEEIATTPIVNGANSPHPSEGDSWEWYFEPQANGEVLIKSGAGNYIVRLMNNQNLYGGGNVRANEPDVTKATPFIVVAMDEENTYSFKFNHPTHTSTGYLGVGNPYFGISSTPQACQLIPCFEPEPEPEPEPALIYTAKGVVGDGTINKAMPFFNTEVEVEVYDNNMVVLKGWDGVEGSDLRIVYAQMNTPEEGDDVEVRNVITYLEQTVNGEVVSMTDAEDNEDGAVERITLFPQSTYAAVEVVLESEMTSAYIGSDEEAGMGYVSLAGLFAKAAVGEPGEDGYQAPEAVSAVYMLQWPGEAIAVPAEMVYEANGVTGTGIAGDNSLFANKAVKVEAYDNDAFIIRSWDGTLGSDLKVYTTKLNTLEEGDDVEVRTVIIGLEQIVNGEVVSELGEDAEGNTVVQLYPQNEEYAGFVVYTENELTGIMLEGEQGQLVLFGQALCAANLGGEDDNMGVGSPVEALYSIRWPGEPVEVPAALVYEANGVTGTGIADDNSLFANKAVHVEAYDNDSFIIRSWDGILGSDLKVYTTKMNTLEEGDDVEVRTVIIGLEQIVNGEVVSELDEDGEGNTIVRLKPQSEVYPEFVVYTADELTGIMLEGEQGQIVLFGQALCAANVGGEDDNMGVASPVEMLYSVIWPGEPVEVATVGNYELSCDIANNSIKVFDNLQITFTEWDNAAFISGNVVAENGDKVALEGGYIDDEHFNTIYVEAAKAIKTAGDYTLNVTVQLYKADAAPAPGMRRAGAVATLSIPFTVDEDSDITTGVAAIQAAAKAAIFNLNGQAVKSAQQGLYIINGKKAVVK